MSTEITKFRVDFVRDFFNELDLREVNYAILSGIDDFPLNIGRDVDIYVAPRHLEKVIQVSDDLFQKSSWDFMWFHDTNLGVIQNYWCKLRGDKLLMVQFDFVSSTESSYVGVAPLMSFDNVMCASNLTSFEGLKINVELYYVKAVVRKLFTGGCIVELPAILQKLDFCPTVISPGTSNWHDIILRTFEKAKVTQKWVPGRSNYCEKAKFNLMFLISNPIRFLVNLFIRYPKRKVNSFLTNHSYSVSVLGPDGVGKSTLLDSVESQIGGFFEIKRIHFRPKLLDQIIGRKISSDSVVDPHSEYVRSAQTRRGAVLRVFYFLTDFWLFKIAKRVIISGSRPSLLINDRGAHDGMIDPVRYRLRSFTFARVLSNLAPAYGLVIALTDTPLAINKRKNELTIEEIAVQNLRIRTLAERGVIHKIFRSGLDLGPNVAKAIIGRFSSSAQNANSHLVGAEGGTCAVFVDGKLRLRFLNHSPIDDAILELLGWKSSRLRRIYFKICALFSVGRVRVKKEFPHLYSPIWKKVRLLTGKMNHAACVLPVDCSRERVTVIDYAESCVFKIGFGAEKFFLEKEVEASRLIATRDWQSFSTPKVLLKEKTDDYAVISTAELKGLSRIPCQWTTALTSVMQELQTLHSTFRAVSAEGLQSCSELFDYDFSEGRTDVIKYAACHGDFTPGNIFIDEEQNLIVLDWEYFSEEAPALVDPVLFFLECINTNYLNKEKRVREFVQLFSPSHLAVATALKWVVSSERVSVDKAVEFFEIFANTQNKSVGRLL